MKKNKKLKVSIVMGSQSDYKTLKLAEKVLKNVGVPYETKIISAHRTPDRMYEYAKSSVKNNIGVIIRCRWISSFTWNDCCTNTFTSIRCANRK